MIRRIFDDLPDWLAVLVSLVVAAAILIGVVLFLALALPGPDQAKAAVEASGFSNVQVSEPLPSLFYCGDGDMVRYEVTANNPRNDKVSLYVCGGVLKGMTIRYH